MVLVVEQQMVVVVDEEKGNKAQRSRALITALPFFGNLG